MFVLSHAVVSVFTITVLLNVFYFVPIQSYETFTVYDTCEDCIKSDCYAKQKHNCVTGTENKVYCIICDKTTSNGDKQFYSQSTCEKNCGETTQCACDGVCYVCALKVDPKTLECNANGMMMYDTTCNEVPYVPEE
jgi:hypothetical protein